MKVFYLTLLLLLALVVILPFPANAAQNPRRGVECRVFSKLYTSWHSQTTPKIDHATIAQELSTKLAMDISTLNLADETLRKIQTKLVTDLQAVAGVFRNIREGELVGDPYVIDRHLPDLQTLTANINSTTQELNKYCRGIWGYRAIPVDK
ncbi:MAG: hypothetical protein RML75_19425 [Cyanobacteriota bacterium SKYGB_h_bin112]|nr:hypothetical protein [Cyanobacteriota bacterium SKYGB_h_bin112]